MALVEITLTSQPNWERACLTFFQLLFLKPGVLTDTHTEGQLGSGEHSSRNRQRFNPEGILPPEEDDSDGEGNPALESVAKRGRD